MGSLLVMLASLIAAAPVGDDAPGALANDLARVSQRRVLFAHQSVGANVLAGLERLSARGGGALHMAEVTAPAQMEGRGFAHAFVERNGEPRLKLASFATLLAATRTPPDIALLKFCYVDIGAQTDVASLFAEYEATFRTLERRYPRTTFIHVTVPLTVVQGGLKGAAKRLLGRAPGGFLDNAKREDFNARLREAYQGNALFDLASLEASSPRGEVVVEWKGRTVRSLDPGSTTDGGHLNATGQDRIARALLAHLAAVP